MVNQIRQGPETLQEHKSKTKTSSFSQGLEKSVICLRQEVIGASKAKLAGWLQASTSGIYEEQPWRSAMSLAQRSKSTLVPGTSSTLANSSKIEWAALRKGREWRHAQLNCATVQKPQKLSALGTLLGNRT